MLCPQKVPYRSRRRALQAAAIARHAFDREGLRVYRCPICRMWHLTSQAPRGAQSGGGGGG